jgi:hypothetical protein
MVPLLKEFRQRGGMCLQTIPNPWQVWTTVARPLNFPQTHAETVSIEAEI